MATNIPHLTLTLKRITFLLIFFIVFAFNSSFSQSSISSLLQQVEASKQDSTTIKISLDLGYKYESVNVDSALFFYDKAIVLSNKTKNFIQKAKALMYKGLASADNEIRNLTT